jgi:hypothetical protein
MTNPSDSNQSRAGDLFERAAASSTPPFRRLYFDTEVLRSGRWPTMNEQFRFCLRLAQMMRIELCVPAPALHERAEQWVREAMSALEAATAKAKSAQDALQPFDAAVTFQGPDEAEIRRRYEDASRAALNDFQIRVTKYPALPLDEVFRTAVARGGTFEEIKSGKGGVVGFQDHVILHSAFDDLREQPVPAAFVSRDGVFSRIPALAAQGVDLRYIPGISDLETILDSFLRAPFSAEFERWWDEVSKRVTEVLTARRDEVQAFLTHTLGTREVEKLFGGKVLATLPPNIKQFGMIRPELKGHPDGPIHFSCDVSVSYKATVENLYSSLQSLLVGLSTSTLPFFGESSSPVQTEQARTVTVELIAQVSTDYQSLTLHSAHIRL